MPRRSLYFKSDVYKFLEKKEEKENRNFSNVVDTIVRKEMIKENKQNEQRK